MNQTKSKLKFSRYYVLKYEALRMEGDGNVPFHRFSFRKF